MSVETAGQRKRCGLHSCSGFYVYNAYPFRKLDLKEEGKVGYVQCLDPGQPILRATLYCSKLGENSLIKAKITIKNSVFSEFPYFFSEIL